MSRYAHSPFVSGEVEKHRYDPRDYRLSTSLETNGAGVLALESVKVRA